MTPGYLVTIGAAIPTVLDRRWRTIENAVRWARSVPVTDVRDFMEGLPGDPIEPSGQEIVDNHVILRSDEEQMDVLVPIRLAGSDQIWGLVFWLDAGSMQPDGEPLWLYGLGEQRLMNPNELRALPAT